MIDLSDLLAIAALYVTVNNDDWTWFPLLTLGYFRNKIQIFSGYVIASTFLYLTCYVVSLIVDQSVFEQYISGSVISSTVGGIFIALGLWRAYEAFFSNTQNQIEAKEEDTITASGIKKYPFLVAIGTVLANGYNNVLVLSPIFAAVGSTKGLLYAVALPCFNLVFAGVLIFAMINFERKMVSFVRKYAGAVGSIAMILLGIKIAFL